MNKNFEILLKSISLGIENIPKKMFSKIEALKLMYNLNKKMKDATSIKNECFETANYFIYIGDFPGIHIAIDNKTGTNRIFTIYNESDLQKINQFLF